MDDLDIEELPINSEVADAVRNLRIADVVRFCIDKENHSGRIVMMQFDNVIGSAIGISIEHLSSKLAGKTRNYLIKDIK